MKSLKTGFGLLATVLTCVAASPAAAEKLVPPGNSAVNQYTESFPTSRGGRDVNRNRGSRPSPKKILGAENARKLERQGQDGQAVAEMTAETAPVTEKASPPAEEPVAVEGDESAGGASRGGDGTGSPPAGNRAPIAPPDTPVASGSSGFTEVIAHATGSSSSGGTGLLLPLFILGTILWAGAYALRQRRPAS